MNETTILIIISALLMPFNLLCIFWIFREVMNLSGVTFKEMVDDIGGTLSTISTSRRHQGSRRRRRVIYNYVLEKSYEPERTKLLFKRYLYSTIPSAFALILTEYIALSKSENTKSIAIIGIVLLFIVESK